MFSHWCSSDLGRLLQPRQRQFQVRPPARMQEKVTTTWSSSPRQPKSAVFLCSRLDTSPWAADHDHDYVFCRFVLCPYAAFQVHMIANIPVVVGNRISRMPLAPSTRCAPAASHDSVECQGQLTPLLASLRS